MSKSPNKCDSENLKIVDGGFKNLFKLFFSIELNDRKIQNERFIKYILIFNLLFGKMVFLGYFVEPIVCIMSSMNQINK